MTTNKVMAGIQRVLEAVAGIHPGLDSGLLKQFLQELFTWNPQVGLVSKKDTERTVIRLIKLSITLWDYTQQSSGFTKQPGIARFMDIGTGGGFPGLIWKMVEPELEGCLVERKDKKVEFLERVIRSTGLSGLEAIPADVEDLHQNPDYQQSFSLVTMLAVKPPPVLAHAIEAFLRPEGYFSTVRSSNQKIIEDKLGEKLILQDALTSNEGIFVLYQKEA